MAPPLAADDGKHGLDVLFAQQSWLRPPFASWQTWPPVTGSVSIFAHAVPVHVALHGEPWQLSSCTATPPDPVHGFEPVRVEVPVVRRSLMSSVPAIWPGSGGQSLESG